MPPKKKVAADREEIEVSYTVIPAFAVRADSDRLSGTVGIGLTAREAINHLRAEVKRRYPEESYIVKEKATNVDLWSATGWREPTYDDKRS